MAKLHPIAADIVKMFELKLGKKDTGQALLNKLHLAAVEETPDAEIAWGNLSEETQDWVNRNTDHRKAQRERGVKEAKVVLLDFDEEAEEPVPKKGKAAKGKSAADEDEDEEDGETKTDKDAGDAEEEEETEEDEEEEAPKSKGKDKKSAAGKSKSKAKPVDEDEDEEEEPAPKAKGKKAASVKAKSKKPAADEDEEEEDAPKTKKGGKGAAKAAPSKKAADKSAKASGGKPSVSGPWKKVFKAIGKKGDKGMSVTDMAEVCEANGIGCYYRRFERAGYLARLDRGLYKLTKSGQAQLGD